MDIRHTPEPWLWVNSDTDEPFDFDSENDGYGCPSLRTVEEFGETKTDVIDGKSYSSFALPMWILDAEPMRHGNDAANAKRIVDCVNACAGMVDPAKEIIRLTALVESYKADAERYKWLRIADNPQMDLVIHSYGDELDEAIDAAMKGKG